MSQRCPQTSHRTPPPERVQAQTNFPTDPPPGIHVTYPRDTHHPVALDGADATAGLRAQARELEQIGEVGGLTVSRVAAPPWTAPGGPASPGWTILTHSGSEAERRAWQRRIGQAAG